MQTNEKGQHPGSIWHIALGIDPKNLLAKFASILTVIVIVTVLFILYKVFTGETARIRYNFGMALLIVGVFSLIPLTFHAIYVRKCLRIQKILKGNYWAYWQDPEVYFTEDGIYYPDAGNKINDFGYSLEKVELNKTQPLSLDFTVLDVRFYGRISQKTFRTIRVDVPPEKEHEAKTLVERYQSKLGKGSWFVGDQWRLSLMMGGGIIGSVILWAIFLAIPLQRNYDAEKRAQDDVYRANQNEKRNAQITPMLPVIRKAMEPKIAHLQTLPDGVLSAEEAGIDKSIPVRKVFYGHCKPSNSFYLYVVLTNPVLEKSYFGETGSFNYTTATGENYYQCGPANYKSAKTNLQLNDGWYYTSLSSYTEDENQKSKVGQNTPSQQFYRSKLEITQNGETSILDITEGNIRNFPINSQEFSLVLSNVDISDGNEFKRLSGNDPKLIILKLVSKSPDNLISVGVFPNIKGDAPQKIKDFSFANTAEGKLNYVLWELKDPAYQGGQVTITESNEKQVKGTIDLRFDSELLSSNPNGSHQLTIKGDFVARVVRPSP